MPSMGLGAAGGAAGAVKGLQDLLEQRFMERKQAEMEASRRADDALRNRQVMLDEETAAGNRAAGQASSAAVAEAIAAIDASNLTPEQKIGAKINVRQGKGLPADFGKPKERKIERVTGLVGADQKPVTAGIDVETGQRVYDLPQYVEPEKPHPLTVAPGGQVIDPYDRANLGKIFRAPTEPKTDTEPLVAITDPVTGQPKLVRRGQAEGQRPASTRDQALTEGQSNAAGFADRMKLNETPIQKFETAAAGRLSQPQSWLPGELQSDAFQSYSAAKRNWIAAQLRKESGAAISQSEYAEADTQYFPQPGDGKAVIDQKRELRKVAEASMRRAAGSAASSSVKVLSIEEER